jgi:hypothetical protein
MSAIRSQNHAVAAIFPILARSAGQGVACGHEHVHKESSRPRSDFNDRPSQDHCLDGDPTRHEGCARICHRVMNTNQGSSGFLRWFEERCQLINFIVKFRLNCPEVTLEARAASRSDWYLAG